MTLPHKSDAIETFGQRVQRERLGMGISLQELARMTGIYSESIRDIESGQQRPGPETQILLARTLGFR